MSAHIVHPGFEVCTPSPLWDRSEGRRPLLVPPRSTAASPGWLSRLAAWADRHPPRHHRLGSYLLLR